MSAPTYILQSTVFEDSGLYLMARVKGNAGTNITQGTIASIALKVYDRTADNEEVYSAALTVSAVVFNTLQTGALDPRWTKDIHGYNFGAAVPASAFATGGHTYRVEVVFTPSSGDQFALVADVHALELLTP